MDRSGRALTVGMFGLGAFMFGCMYLPPGPITPFLAVTLALAVAIAASWGLRHA